MARRLLVQELFTGDLALEAAQAHHARDVLRLKPGDEVELFTPAGKVTLASLIEVSSTAVVARVAQITQVDRPFELLIASAIPKGSRADWMIEKLSELGVATFIPLMTQRSVVHPEGAGKLKRWERIAAEASRQSGRPDVMLLLPLTPLPAFLDRRDATHTAYLSTEPAALPITNWLGDERQKDEGREMKDEKRDRSFFSQQSAILLIGPEGGWSPQELEMFRARHLTGLALGGTILRVETAAIAAAAVVAAAIRNRGFLKAPSTETNP